VNEIQGHWFLKCHKNGKIQLSIMTPTPCRVAALNALYLLVIRTHALVYLLNYLHSLLGVYKTGNISETVEDKAKVTIDGLYKVVHGLSIAAKMYDLE